MKTLEEKILDLMEKKRKQNTYTSNGHTWTIPDNTLSISLTELKELLNE